MLSLNSNSRSIIILGLMTNLRFRLEVRFVTSKMNEESLTVELAKVHYVWLFIWLLLPIINDIG
jgi:hypothetical protein